MATIDVKDAAEQTVAIEKPLAPGRAAASGSRPVALSTEDKAVLDGLATQTTLASILAKIIAAPASEAKQDTQITALNAILASHVGAYTAVANFTPAAAAYGAGDIMDVAKELSFVDINGVAVPSGTLIRVLTAVLKIDVTSVPAGQTSYTAQCYGVTPPSAQADNDAWTLASADLTAYKGSIALGTPVDLGAALYVKSQYIDFDIRLTGTGLFVQLVTVGAHTAAAVVRQLTLHAIAL